MLAIPQVFPILSLMNPYSPHEVAQEFLIIQKSALNPTPVTPWFKFAPQFENTPPL